MSAPPAAPRRAALAPAAAPRQRPRAAERGLDAPRGRSPGAQGTPGASP